MRRFLFVLAAAALLGFPWAQAAPESLAADGRLALVADRQGLVLVRPAGRQRWSPVSARAALYPGDRLRTESLGAHAVDLRLQAGGRLTLGPASLLELALDGSAFTLLGGEAEVTGAPGAAVSVRGPGGFALAVEGPVWLRSRDGRVERLAEAPRWLTGYRKGLSDEWMGSLVATIDGAPVPLHVGSVKVDVEVLDQVARTTVEQTFVNGTAGTLEGVFRFPLPAEASIAGFGMWIGAEYVEADVVERERARQIYEDILARQKDPGLLEWAGGNVFQARVFPIPPHAEKRVRLRYTEVLPLEGRTWRYRYALRSELLRLHPLRELALTVRAASTQPIEDVACPTHADAVVSRPSPGTALVELSRRDFAPDRDLEVAVRLKASPGLTAVAHRRGGEGWFLLLLQPPQATAEGWERDLVPEGRPLDLLVAVDTSGSVDPAARRAQEAFLAALLGLLGPDDRVRLAAFDVDTRFLSPTPRPADADFADEARRFLAARPPQGWTDLEGAVGALSAAAGPGTQVIVLTDGIATSGDPDPAAVAGRLRAGAASLRGTFHAVAPAATYERPVLEALASVGGGSVRHLREDPAGVARALLTEAALPLLKDARVEIEGLPAARVYPEVLPPLPLGHQQAVLGRLLPGPAGGSATVTVRGTLEGQPVSYRATLAVPPDGEGNSFLPRLWARRHLDALLAEGPTAAVREEVVRFSTEYGILTPYTSLLVLESDEDRERYGVTRRVHARDGEAEFAAARDRVALEAAREAARTARAYRLGLRRQMLLELAGLGRDVPIPVPSVALAELALWSDAEQAVAAAPPTYGGRTRGGYADAPEASSWGGADSGPGGVGGGFDELRTEDKADHGLAAPSSGPAGKPAALREADDRSDAPFEGPQAGRRLGGGGEGATAADDALFDDLEAAEEEALESAKVSELGRLRSVRKAGRPAVEPSPFAPLPPPSAEPSLAGLGLPVESAAGLGSPEPPDPPLADAATRELLERLLAPADEGLCLELRATRELRHAPTQALRATSSRRLLRGPRAWWLRSESPGVEPEERSFGDGLLTRLRVGTRVAASAAAGPGAGWSMAALRRALGCPSLASLAGERVRLRPAGAGAPPLLEVGGTPGQPAELWRLDPARGLVVERLRLSRSGAVTGRTLAADPVELGGRWWPTRLVEQDERGRIVRLTTIAFEALEPAALAERLTAALRGRDDVVTVGPQVPTVAQARRAERRGLAGWPEYLVLAAERLAAQRYDECWAHAERVLQALEGRPFALWLRGQLLARTRRGEALVAYAESTWLPRALAGEPALAWALSRSVEAAVAGQLAPLKRLELLARLEPVWAAAGPLARRDLGERRIEALFRAQRPLQARALRAALVEEHADDFGLRRAHAEDLARNLSLEAGLEALAAALRAPHLFLDGELDALHERRADWLLALGRTGELREALAAWGAARPDAVEAQRRLLSLAYALGEEGEADAWVRDTLAAAPADPPVGPDGPASDSPARRSVEARRQAAVTVALGDGWGWRARGLLGVGPAPLVAAARAALLADDERLALGVRILADARVAASDAGRAAREAVRAELTAEGAVARLSLARLHALLSLLPSAPEDLDAATAERLLAGLVGRLGGEDVTPAERRALAERALRLVSLRREPLRGLEVLRAWREAARGRERPAATERLIRALAAASYAPEREAEALGLLTALAAEAPEPQARALGLRGVLLRSLTAWAVPGRADLALGTPEQRAARSRLEARAAEREARRTARTAFAEALLSWARSEPQASALHGWTTLERAALLSEVGRSLPEVVEALVPLLPPPGAEPGPAPAPSSPTALPPAPDPGRGVREALEARALLTLSHAAVRRETPPALVERVLGLLLEREASSAHDVRYALVRLWIALDRVDDLRGALLRWSAEPVAPPRYARLLAHVEAELGRLGPATAALEPLLAVEGALGPPDLHALAAWLLALGEDGRRKAALAQRFALENEWTLQSRLQAESGRIGRRGGAVADDLDPELLPAVGALLAKASWPGNHLWVVRNLYRASKDHRVLAGLVEGVPGHTPEAAYGFLGQVGGLLGDVHEEAALDALREALHARLSGGLSPGERRGLKLFEALVETRASQVLLKDGRVPARAVAALDAALLGVEPAALRPLLAVLAAFPKTPAAAIVEQRRLGLEGLLERADAASGDRLAVAAVLARVLADGGRADEGLDRLTRELDAALAAADPRALAEWPAALDVRLALLASLGRFAQAERVVEAAREAAALSPEQRRQLGLRLLRLYVEGAAARGTFSFGSGEALVRGALERVERAWQAAPREARALHGVHVELFQAGAKTGALPAAGAERARFAAERLPGLLTGLPGVVAALAEAEAQALAELAGPRDALRFLLARDGAEPPFYARVGADVWSENRYRIAEWRSKGEPLGDLEAPLRAFVLARLRDGLERDEARSEAIWSADHRWFWASQQGELLAAILAAAEGAPDSPARQRACAQAASIVGRPAEAADLLLAALGRGVIDRAGRELLLGLLLRQHRFEPALPLVEGLLAETPEALPLGLRRLEALVGLERASEADAALEALVARFATAPTSAGARTLGQIAVAASELKMHAAAVPLLERALTTRLAAEGRPDGVDAGWRAALARSFSALGRVDAAVEAAAASLVGTGARTLRWEPGNLLVQVLEAAPDLPAFAARHEERVRATGADVPLVRRALAWIFRERRRMPAAALPQLVALAALAPGDPSVLRDLTAVHDATNAPGPALEALTRRLALEPGDAAGWADLAARHARSGDAAAAERARTGAVEARPLEPDGHRLIARTRRDQGRLREAAERWALVTRLRPLEPEARVEEARCWIDAGEPARARRPLEEVLAGTFEARFASSKAEAARLLAGLK